MLDLPDSTPNCSAFFRASPQSLVLNPGVVQPLIRDRILWASGVAGPENATRRQTPRG